MFSWRQIREESRGRCWCYMPLRSHVDSPQDPPGFGERRRALLRSAYHRDITPPCSDVLSQILNFRPFAAIFCCTRGWYLLHTLSLPDDPSCLRIVPKHLVCGDCLFDSCLFSDFMYFRPMALFCCTRGQHLLPIFPLSVATLSGSTSPLL